MDHAERCVTVFYRIGDYADSKEIEDLVEGALLLLDLQMERIEALNARLNLGGDAVFDHLGANRVLDLVQEFIEDFLLGGNFLLDVEEGFGLEIAEGEFFELAANQAHAQAVGDRSINIERLAGNALLALGIEEFERAHIVEPVRELDHDDANVIDHGEEHLADVFSLASLGSEEIQAADFCGAFDEARDVHAEVI